jgi:hypothetical protein
MPTPKGSTKKRFETGSGRDKHGVNELPRNDGPILALSEQGWTNAASEWRSRGKSY